MHLFIWTDEDPRLRIESVAVINLRGVSTKLNLYCCLAWKPTKNLLFLFFDNFLYLPTLMRSGFISIKVHWRFKSTQRHGHSSWSVSINYLIMNNSNLCCVALRCLVLFCSVLFCSVLFCSVLFCSVLFCSVLFCSVLFCSVLFCAYFIRARAIFFCII